MIFRPRYALALMALLLLASMPIASAQRGGNAPGTYTPPPSGKPPPDLKLPQDEQDDFTRQEKLAPQLHDRTRAIVDQLAGELAGLRPRLQQELVGKQFLPQGRGSAPLKPNADMCPRAVDEDTPCKGCEALAAGNFNAWFDAWIADSDAKKAEIDKYLADWTTYRQQMHDKLMVYAWHKPEFWQPLDQVLKDWRAQETQFYRLNYRAAAYEQELLWQMYLAEAIGLYIRQYPKFAGSLDASGQYHRGVADFGGRLGVTINAETIGLYSQLHAVAAAGCQYGTAAEKFITAPPLDANGGVSAAKLAAEKDWGNAAQAFEAALQPCRQAEDAQRDAFAAQLRTIRDGLISTRSGLRQKLGQWRQQMIAAHLYAGDGDAAISAIYGDGSELRLDQDGPAWGNFAVEHGCYMVAPDLGSGAADTAQAAVKYPDIETQPYVFKLDLSEARKIAGTASGADARESP